MTPEKWKELRRLVARGEHYEYCGHKLPSLDEQCDCWMSKVLALIDAELAAPTHMDATIAEMALTIERLRASLKVQDDANKILTRRLSEAEAESRRLRDAIERAPHAFECPVIVTESLCNCWKREALATAAERKVCRWEGGAGDYWQTCQEAVFMCGLGPPKVCTNCGLPVEKA